MMQINKSKVKVILQRLPSSFSVPDFPALKSEIWLLWKQNGLEVESFVSTALSQTQHLND